MDRSLQVGKCDRGTNLLWNCSINSDCGEETNMNDDRVWEFEASLWTGDAQHYQELIDKTCLMVLPTGPFIFDGNAAVNAVSVTPRWTSIDITDRQIARPQDGLIVVAYSARASRGESEVYKAHCTSTYRRLGHDNWKVVQHQQSPPLTIG